MRTSLKRRERSLKSLAPLTSHTISLCLTHTHTDSHRIPHLPPLVQQRSGVKTGFRSDVATPGHFPLSCTSTTRVHNTLLRVKAQPRARSLGTDSRITLETFRLRQADTVSLRTREPVYAEQMLSIVLQREKEPGRYRSIVSIATAGPQGPLAFVLMSAIAIWRNPGRDDVTIPGAVEFFRATSFITPPQISF